MKKSIVFAGTPKQRTCVLGLQVGTRTYLDSGITVSGVFGLPGWEDPCPEPVTVRCQLAFNGKPAPYYWFACANPLHQRDAWLIEHLDADGKVTHVTQGVRTLEEPREKLVLSLTPKRKRKPKRSKEPQEK